MTGNKQFIVSLFLLFCIVAIGTAGYVVIEGWGIVDAIYMTVITLATVGFSEVHQMGEAGKLFTMGLIVIGGGFFIYVAGAIVQLL